MLKWYAPNAALTTFPWVLMQNTTYDSDYRSGETGLAPTRQDKLLAWSAHFITATGVIWGLFSLLAIARQQWVWALAWLAVAIAVDSFDGYLARWVRVKAILPEFDGALLDNIVDYLTYTFIPAYWIAVGDLLPPQVRVAGAVLILLASAYQFCQIDAKTQDHFFKGFPSYWNIMVFYLFVLNLNGWANAAIVLLLGVLVFVPIKYIYPSRTTLYPRLTMVLAAIWGIANLVILVTHPHHPLWLVALSLAFALYYVGLSIWATVARR